MCVNIYLALIPLYVNLHDDNVSINNLQYILKSDRLHWGLNVHECYTFKGLGLAFHLQRMH